MYKFNPCVYAVSVLGTDLIYIGEASDFENSRMAHLYGMRGGRSDNPRMQAAYDQYGESAFSFSLLERFDDTMVGRRLRHDCKRSLILILNPPLNQDFPWIARAKKKMDATTITTLDRRRAWGLVKAKGNIL